MFDACVACCLQSVQHPCTIVVNVLNVHGRLGRVGEMVRVEGLASGKDVGRVDQKIRIEDGSRAELVKVRTIHSVRHPCRLNSLMSSRKIIERIYSGTESFQSCQITVLLLPIFPVTTIS